MSAYRDKVLGFGTRGPFQTNTTMVEREHGGQAGAQIEHRDGRVDATVFPEPVELLQRQDPT